MIRILPILLMLAALPQALQAQVLTLDECLRAARANYPAIRQYGLIEQSRDYTVLNAARGWLPRVSASATGAVFTDVVDIPAQMAAMTGSMKNYIASGSLTVSQPIYDGGSIASQKRLTGAQADVQSRRLDVSVYEVNARVEQVFFGILTLDEQLRQNRLLQDDLTLSQRTVASMMRGGVANQSDADAVSVQQVVAQQQEDALLASREAFALMLSTLTGLTISAEATVERPQMPLLSDSNQRPELAWFNAQSRLLDEQERQLDTQLMPRLSAFGMAMLHSPVMSLVNNGMLAAGLTLSWNIAPLYTRRADCAKINLQRQQVESERDVFLFNTRLQQEQSDGVAKSIRRQIERDDEIIRLRESIRQKSEKKVQLGTETVNELLRNINAVSEARQAKALHEVQLLQELYRQRNIIGDFWGS